MCSAGHRTSDAQIAHGDTFHNDRHPDLKADYVLANPPFNDSNWPGEWKDFRDCHVKPDLVLIYRKIGNEALQLVRLGSHSELGF